MSILGRISELITANVNALLDQAENPERMLAQALREMEQVLAATRQQTVAAIAAERRLGRELEQYRTQTTHWKEQARFAVARGRDDLARQALKCMVEHESLTHALEPQHAAARGTSREARQALRTLEARLADARRRKRIILARQQAARVQRTLQVASSRDPFGPFARFEHFENWLADWEDQLLAQVEVSRTHGGLEAELTELETTARVDAEMAALKQAIEANAPAPLNS